MLSKIMGSFAKDIHESSNHENDEDDGGSARNN